MAENSELEDLEHLVSMAGWGRFAEMVDKQWGRSGERYTDAINNAARGDDVNALQQLRQIIVAQREIQTVLAMVQNRIKLLKTPQLVAGHSRRGGL